MLGISGNVLLLIYYKYADFLLVNIGEAVGFEVTLLNLVLPLGISFFTFTQIAYLVDAYKGKAREYNIINYVLFVTFYPHLIAGPILHHGEMMPQFDRIRSKLWDWGNAASGVFIFCIGLFKKVVIADSVAIYANAGFDTASGFVDSWIAALSYTFQLYFDFSGYTDMAIGAALLFNIRLPQNFNSPYKALNIQDFWRRWHMTLSRFLRDYIYIPLGGNRRGEMIMLRNLMLTFLIGGLWHGAGWTFLFWGLLHGVGASDTSFMGQAWRTDAACAGLVHYLCLHHGHLGILPGGELGAGHASVEGNGRDVGPATAPEWGHGRVDSLDSTVDADRAVLPQFLGAYRILPSEYETSRPMRSPVRGLAHVYHAN